MPGAQEVDGELLGELLDWLREPVVITDPLGKIVRASRSAAVALGSPPQLEGMLFVTFVAPDDRRRFRRVLQAAAARRAVEVVLRPPEAPTFLARLEVERTDQRLYWSIGFGEASDELQRGLGRLIEGLSEGLAVVDRALRVGLANRAALQLLGVETGARLPRRWGEFASRRSWPRSSTSRRCTPRRSSRQGTASTPSPGCRRAAGGTHCCSSQTRRPASSGSGGSASSSRMRRTSSRRPSRPSSAQWRSSRRGRRTTPTRGTASSPTCGASPSGSCASSRACSCSRRRTPGRRARDLVPVRELLDDAASRLQVREGVRVEVLAPPGLDVVTHRALAGRAVGTLAENAAKHTREGRILLVGRSGRHGIVLEVHDTGPGMPESVRARAFDRFYRGERDGDGFGLGLSIAWQAANALGGTLELDSAPGAGTVARLVLPRVRTA
jgi:PAS domain-containing protein